MSKHRSKSQFKIIQSGLLICVFFDVFTNFLAAPVCLLKKLRISFFFLGFSVVLSLFLFCLLGFLWPTLGIGADKESKKKGVKKFPIITSSLGWQIYSTIQKRTKKILNQMITRTNKIYDFFSLQIYTFFWKFKIIASLFSLSICPPLRHLLKQNISKYTLFFLICVWKELYSFYFLTKSQLFRSFLLVYCSIF